MNTTVKNLIERAKVDKGILAVLLFGSQARGEGGPESDIDLCFVLSPGEDHKHDQIKARLKYLPLRGIDVQIYQALPLYIRIRILREGNVLYCRDLDLLYEMAFRTVKAFEDFKPRYQHYLDQVANAGS